MVILRHTCTNTMCPCKNGEQTTDHILYDCELVEQEKGRLKAAVLRSENWPVIKIFSLANTEKLLKNLRTVYPLTKHRTQNNILISHHSPTCKFSK